ncbi:MAG: redoxin domain-containing protein [Planctomycetaceae bacterium]
MIGRNSALFLASLSCLMFLSSITNAAEGEPPQVGDVIEDVAVKNLQGESVKLFDVAGDGPVVILVLRGYPGYQCPICTRQVGQYIGSAKKFQAAHTKVVMIYPGPGVGLTEKANEFLKDASLPENFVFVTDPDYVFTNAWNLRWDAPRETAYPSTFVLDPEHKVLFTHISKTHGNRTAPADVLKVLSEPAAN